jgi:hypothetical protein
VRAQRREYLLSRDITDHPRRITHLLAKSGSRLIPFHPCLCQLCPARSLTGSIKTLRSMYSKNINYSVKKSSNLDQKHQESMTLASVPIILMGQEIVGSNGHYEGMGKSGSKFLG